MKLTYAPRRKLYAQRTGSTARFPVNLSRSTPRVPEEYTQRTPSVGFLILDCYWASGAWAMTEHFGWSNLDPIIIMDLGSRPIW